MAKKTFEDSLAQLESIVEALESGDLPLEKAIKTFEEGVRLSRFCFEKLDETEKKINLLLKDKDGIILENPFFESENEQENG